MINLRAQEYIPDGFFLNKVQSLANENDVHIVSRTIDINTDQFYQ